MSDELRARLKSEVHRVDWKPLGPHAKRGGLVLVDSELDLLDVAFAVATDDSVLVQRWMEAGALRRPSDEQVEAWRKVTDDCFTVVIVQPYVLAQRTTPRDE
jgi:hypothetical protein